MRSYAVLWPTNSMGRLLMPRLMLLGDLHAADRPPSLCSELYLSDLLDLVKAASDLAKSLDCVAAIQAGDTFHVKVPSRNSHRLVLDVIDAFGNFSCPVYIVPGNHDMSNNRFESLFDTQPLGVVLQSGA